MVGNQRQGTRPVGAHVHMGVLLKVHPRNCTITTVQSATEKSHTVPRKPVRGKINLFTEVRETVLEESWFSLNLNREHFTAQMGGGEEGRDEAEE